MLVLPTTKLSRQDFRNHVGTTQPAIDGPAPHTELRRRLQTLRLAIRTGLSASMSLIARLMTAFEPLEETEVQRTRMEANRGGSEAVAVEADPE